MEYTFAVLGESPAEINDKAHEVCEKFFGVGEYDILYIRVKDDIYNRNKQLATVTSVWNKPPD